MEGARVIARVAVHGKSQQTREACSIHKRLLVDQVLDEVLREWGSDAKLQILSLEHSMKVAPSCIMCEIMREKRDTGLGVHNSRELSYFY
jgi:hypothetical protein